ncbi:threonylcarbamoyl-AMP synthase [Aureimonas sp. SA4125]|uniref:L-threonylcarbamoyladenylate synthase n=1 Tax=Aureimonas sp. SA4125 TaxID=2826993 RepID=UPI001CC59827|nr:L-threonylcarbamoyladenylate synthase [Aureimonas sp. SA4125]BDA83066.1 threonylcarbamoyl-AMP synthase [Aureimonas sp. SA4125]
MARHILSTDPDAVRETVAVLLAGGLAALPTETVYGLGADAANGAAVAGIFEAKGRPRFNPLICHVSDRPMAEETGIFDDTGRRLVDAFWPGPLTVVLPLADGADVHPLTLGGLSTVALRMPQGIARDVIAGVGRPIAAPSANRSGKVSPTTSAHVERSLGDRIDLILDAGPAILGLESTIVMPREGEIVLLRAGGITAADIETATGLRVVRPADGAPVQSPGQLVSHYAPHGTVRLDALSVLPGEWLLRFGSLPVAGEDRAAGVIDLSPRGDLRETASKLFAALTELDRPDVAAIAVMPIPMTGLGEAINDRLRRAAAPRG